MDRIFYRKFIFCLLFSLCILVQVSAQAQAGRVDGGAHQSPARPSNTLQFDLLHTRLDLRFDIKKQQISGAALLTVRPYFYPQDTLTLDAKGLDVHGVYLMKPGDVKGYQGENRLGSRLVYRYNLQKLRIALDKRYIRSDTLFLLIEYTATPGRSADSLEVKRDEMGMYFINGDEADPDIPVQVWTQGEPESSARWFPTIESPADKFTQDFYLTVERQYLTLSNGLLQESTNNSDGTRTDHWHQSLPHSAYLAMVAVGKFAAVKEKTDNGIEVSYYVEPSYAGHAKAIFGRTPEMIRFFSKTFGVPFPWEKYAQVAVRNFVSGAMENTTATVHAEDIQQDSIALRDGNSDGIIAHELAHHWFGNLVTCASWGQLPLNESFANYSEYLWAAYKEGVMEADFLNYREMTAYFSEAEQKKLPLIRYHYGVPREMFDNHSYAKGGRVLHMLRNYVGDAAFFESLEKYLTRYRFQAVEIDHLRLVFEETTGEDLKWFFDQWFMKPGHPVLSVSQRFDVQTKQLTIGIEQLQDTIAEPLFRLPLKVEILGTDTKTLHSIVVDQRSQIFRFAMDEAPALVIVDSEAQLLGEIQHHRSTKERIVQYDRSDKILFRYQALDSLEGRLDENGVFLLVMRAMEDSFWAIRQKAIGLLFEYKGSKQGEVIRRLKDFAVHDSASVVRAEAIQILGTIEGYNHEKFLESLLNDRSYFVVSVALESYLKNNPSKARAIAKRFRDSPDGAILEAVGVYYAVYGKDNQYAWFVKKLSTMRSLEKSNFLQAFARYLLKADETQQKGGMAVLARYLTNSSSFRVRFGAYQSLALFSDRPEIAAVLREVFAAEKDERQLELYKQFGEF